MLTNKSPKKKITHDQAQSLRRRIIADSTRLSVFGSLMLDYDLQGIDDSSIIYIAALFIRHGDNPNVARWYMKLLLPPAQKVVENFFVDKTEDYAPKLMQMKLKDFKTILLMGEHSC